MKLLTADQMRALEHRADANGNTYAIMMERAGKAVADGIAKRMRLNGKNALVLVGPGNNGGDGLVCARHLSDMGARVSLYLWKRVENDSDENLKQCRERQISTLRAEEDSGFADLGKLVDTSDVIVDALLGTGVARPIEGLLKDLLLFVNKQIASRQTSQLSTLVPRPYLANPLPFSVAIDLPTGLNPDSGALDPATLNANLTVTFAFPKIGHLTLPGANAVGELDVADIGIPAEWANEVVLEVASAQQVAALLPARPRDAHKGTFGKAMLCVGSTNYTGAAFLAGSAATHVGAGLVTMALARTIYPMVASGLREATFVVLPDDLGALVPEAARVLREHLTGYDALVIGCGFGRDPKTVEFAQRLLGMDVKKANVGFATKGGESREGSAALPRMVIDADAFFALTQSGEWWKRLAPRSAILTPHPGEMAALTGLSRDQIQENRSSIATQFAAQWQQVVVLKGAHTVVASPDGHSVLLPFATPALATAGTGDVLAGTIGGLLAQFAAMNRPTALVDAAIAGGYLHGLAGEIAQWEIGSAGVVAGDLLSKIPTAIRQIKGN